jgi:hypothetical protein
MVSSMGPVRVRFTAQLVHVSVFGGMLAVV